MNKELEEAVEKLEKFKTIKVLYGNTFVMHLEQLQELQIAIETVLEALNNSTSNYVLYDLAREMRRNGSHYWEGKLCERINKGGTQ